MEKKRVEMKQWWNHYPYNDIIDDPYIVADIVYSFVADIDEGGWSASSKYNINQPVANNPI